MLTKVLTVSTLTLCCGLPDISFANAKNVNIFTSDDTIPCENISALLESTPPGPKRLSILTRFNECEAVAYNEAHPEEPVVVVGSMHENGTPYFTFISAKDVEDFANICHQMHTAAGLTDIDPVIATVIGGSGEMRCSLYVDAIVSEDPMLFVFPLSYPEARIAKHGAKITEQFFTEVVKKPGDVITRKPDPTDGKPDAGTIIAPTVTVPVEIMCKLFC